MVSIKSSLQNEIEEGEAYVAFNSLVCSIRNPMKCAMEEEALIRLESLLLSIRNSMQNDIEDEDHISLESLLLSNGNGKGTPSFHSIPYCCRLGIQFIRIIIESY
jgi:hypothetical protein